MTLYILRDILDKEIVGSNGYKGGKVDDLLIEMREGQAPVVKAIITGPGSLSRRLGGPVAKVVTWLRTHVVGITGVHEVILPWEHVRYIDVVVHLDVPRERPNLLESEEVIWHRWLSHIPGGE